MQIHDYIFRRLLFLNLAIASGLIMIIVTVQIIGLDDLLISGVANLLQLLGLAFLAVLEFVPILLIIGAVTAIHLIRKQLALIMSSLS